ncbi:hypothetical protein EUA06_01950 [Nocardioides glacieisoli]|uniref:Fibronectin type-III domain-containing protein n=1 Tax=Nocardioides glacieisoli TaxID=1168730 RepID=A0A4Q2S3P0_9ACTN|nr:Ig-like domain repeat protein [Nocardioides glacieisoli]RYB96360.1 hypothetical protein EUA06_01950 [Nocardioides glacieisoli]
MSNTFTGRRFVAASMVSVAALTVATLAPGPAAAVPPAAPADLGVQQPDTSTAILTWSHVAGAIRYEVQVDDDPNFGSLAAVPSTTNSTVNNTFVPTASLPSGDKYWRVRARGSASEVSDWSIGTFGTPAVTVPQPASPANGAPLAQPSQPPLLTWSSSSGATSYVVEVDGDDDFVGASKYTTSSTSLVVPDPLPSGTVANPADYYWRVTASKGNGINSQPSAAFRFIIGPLPAPTITAPPSSPSFELQDIVLNWNPVPGAMSYDVEVATNSDFTNITETRSGITGTRYSPPVTYDNDQYYWRVRARDLDDQPTPWTASLYDFNRTWPDMPQAVFPAEAGLETVAGPIYFEWTSVRHASEYEVWLSTTPGFSEPTTEKCRTAGTTYTPGMFAVNTNGILSPNRTNEDCEPIPGVPNYWQVRPLDRPFTKSGDLPGIQGIFSEPQGFIYDPLQITGMSPSGGQTVTVPTLSWTASVGAEKYRVVIKDKTGGTVENATTYSTSFTLPGTRVLAPADGPFTWELTATSSDGIQSVTRVASFQVTGLLPPPPASPADYLTPLTGTQTDGPFYDAPALSWRTYPGAARYQVRVGAAMDGPGQIWFGHDSNDLFFSNLPYPAMTDTGERLLLPGDYDWQVIALNSSGTPIAYGPETRMTIAAIPATSEHAAAIGGRELDPSFSGTRTPCVPGEVCIVPTTPVLRWKADPRIAFYMVYVSRDASFTNLLEPSNAIPATTNSMYAPALDNRFWTYPETEAGEALYWFVRPCRNAGNCGPTPVSTIGRAQHFFTKTSPKVTGLKSSDPSGTEITFEWDDYFDTNRSTAWLQTQELRPQSAMQYRIQVDDTESFGTGTDLVDERTVDQPTYTAFDRLYPEGTLYWRVQAIDSKGDSAGNGRLSWSDVKTLKKESPRVVLGSPVNAETVAGTVALRWSPQPFAQEYKVELFRNNDTSFSAANNVFSKTVRTTAYAHSTPLPASQTYVWRVQRIDADGNPGPWSWSGENDANPLGRFTVGTNVMEITSPLPGSMQPPNGPVLTWRSLPGAVKYSVEVTAPGGSLAATAETVATAFAPTSNLVTGTYGWKVTAKDASGNSIGATTSTFTVDAGVRATAAPVISAPAGTGIGATLVSSPPSWNQSNVAETYQWLRDGKTISGATGATYVLTATDYLKAISLRVTGIKPGYVDGETTSNVIGATAGGALQATVQPSITGDAISGGTLRVSPGTWSQPSPTLKYQWLRSGAPIPGATGTTYRVTPEDAGKNIGVTVLASKTGFSDGSANAVAVAIPKLKSTTAATLSATRIKPGTRAKVGITVTVPGVKGPVGVLKIMDRTKVLKTLTLVTAKNGKITFKLPKLKKGKHRILVKYLGDATTEGSRSKALRLSVQP